ncbi:TolC family protein [Noviherbaspirillum agri]
MKKLFVFVAAVASTVETLAQEKLSLPMLESMVMSSPPVRIAVSEREAAEARHGLALSNMAPKLFVSGTAASTKDPVRPERYGVETTQASGAVNRSETVLTADQERYARYSAVIGLQIPLFGRRDALLKTAEIAESNIAIAKAREKVAQMETLKGLRYAYAEHYFRREQARLARSYSYSQGDTLKVLDARMNARLILNADYKALKASLHTAGNDEVAANALAAESAAKIQKITGYPRNDFEVQVPQFPVNCRLATAGADDAQTHPTLQLLASALEEKRRALALAGRRLPDSGLTISQGLSRYENGHSGTSTAVSIDIMFPLGGPDPHSTAKNLALAEMAKAQIELDQQRQEYLSAIEKVKREVVVRQEHIAMLEQRLGAAKEAERVARLRVSHRDGDTVAHLVRTRHALYQAFYEQLDAELMLAKARIDMMGLGDCAGEAKARTDLVTQAEPLLMQTLLPPQSLHFRSASLQGAKKDQVIAARDSNVPLLGWYAWHAFNRFKPANADAFWEKIPRTNRVLLSLNALQIEGVTTRRAERRRLNAFLSSARKRQIEVGLLLGDPGWIQPGEDKKLLRIVEQLNGFGFSGIHLDIEKSQVPDDKKALWAPGLVSLVRDLHGKTDLPIAVTLHPRDVAVEGLLSGLKDAGAAEVALMQYSTNQDRVTDNIANVMRSHPDLRFSLAQSIEPVLSKEESYAKRPKKTVVSAFHKIALRLQAEPNFAGIIVQSLDDYLNGALYED